MVVEGNHYFPRDAVRADVLVPSDTTSVCPWKGTASYFTVVVDGEQNPDAAWYYPTPRGRGRGDQGPRRVLARASQVNAG